MTDNDTPAAEPVDNNLVDEVVERLMDRADVSPPYPATAGC